MKNSHSFMSFPNKKIKLHQRKMEFIMQRTKTCLRENRDAPLDAELDFIWNAENGFVSQRGLRYCELRVMLGVSRCCKSDKLPFHLFKKLFLDLSLHIHYEFQASKRENHKLSEIKSEFIGKKDAVNKMAVNVQKCS